MSTIRVEQFDESFSEIWDNFVSKSKNGTFMLTRKFINYHGDKFEDASLLIFKNDKLLAVFPANKTQEKIYSHQGLSYGGLVFKPYVKLHDALAVFHAVLVHYHEKGAQELFTKQIPSLHHKTPSEEMLYAFFVTNSEIYRRDAT